MTNCFQTEGMSIYDHGISVREWYCDLRDYILVGDGLEKTWKLPSWIKSDVVKNYLSSFDDMIAEMYQIYHDCGKPFCREVDKNGNQHFPDHANVSKRIYLENSLVGTNKDVSAVAELIGMDMDFHQLRADEVDEFARRPQAIMLLITALCEIHSNSVMFGGLDSTNFKIKFKNIERFGKRIVNQQSLTHYVIIRADLPNGVQLAQTIHAAGESADGPLPSGTIAVALEVSDEAALRNLAKELWNGEIPHKLIVEVDGAYANQAMALGIFPTFNRDKIKKYTGHLRLVK